MSHQSRSDDDSSVAVTLDDARRLMRASSLTLLSRDSHLGIGHLAITRNFACSRSFVQPLHACSLRHRVSARPPAQRTPASGNKPRSARARRKSRHSRVSQCFNLSGSDFRLHKGPRASLRRKPGLTGSHPARSVGEFSLRLRAATMVIYLMRGESGRNAAEGMEELRSEHALSWRGRG